MLHNLASLVGNLTSTDFWIMGPVIAALSIRALGKHGKAFCVENITPNAKSVVGAAMLLRATVAPRADVFGVGQSIAALCYLAHNQKHVVFDAFFNDNSGFRKGGHTNCHATCCHR